MSVHATPATPDNRRALTEATFHVRFAETDMMRIVHHANYLIYFEEGRSELSRRVGAPYSALESRGFSLALSDVRVRYVSPARYDDLITVRTWLGQVLSRAITFEHEVVDSATGVLHVRGTVKAICVDHGGTVHRFPEDWIKPFKQATGL